MWEGFVAAVICCWKILLYGVGLILGGAFAFLAVVYGISIACGVTELLARKSEAKAKFQSPSIEGKEESVCAEKF